MTLFPSRIADARARWAAFVASSDSRSAEALHRDLAIKLWITLFAMVVIAGFYR